MSKLVSLKFPPGTFRNGTKYQAKGRWYDAQLVRFLEGAKRPIGGWETFEKDDPPVDLDFAATGVLTLDDNPADTETVTIDTKVYTFKPAITGDDDVDGNVKIGGSASASLDNLIAAINLAAGGGSTYAASMTVHPTVTAVAGPGDTMYADAKTAGLSGVSIATTEALDGAWGSATLVANVPRTLIGWRDNSGPQTYLGIGTNSKVYTFTQGALTDRTPEGFTAGQQDTSVVVGLYGSGKYGLYNFGEGDPAASALVEAGSWQLDTFGDWLVGVHSADGKCWYWDQNAATMVQMTESPTSCLGIVVTPERFIVALGEDGDPRGIKWATQQGGLSVSGDWTASSATTAGEFVLPGVGSIMCGRRGRNETLIFTDEDLFALQYIGGSLIYAIKQVGSKCGIVSRHAIAMVDGRAIWMGQRGFFQYDGYVRSIRSSINDDIFKDFNRTQRHKCFAWPLGNFGEVIFFYPSASSMEPDKYAIYNHREEHWTNGSLDRTAGIDRGAFEYPIMADVTKLYDHERGTSHSGGATPYLESGPIEVGEGDRVMSIQNIIPDESTLAGQVLGSVQAYLHTALYPTATETENGPYTLANPTSVRLTARQVRLKIEELTAGDWRLGTIRLEGVLGGRR